MTTNRKSTHRDGLLFKLTLVFLVLFCTRTLSASAENPIVQVGVYENAPKIFTSESGKPAGIFIDIIEKIAKDEGWTLRYVSGTWGEGLDRLASGQIDLMPDVAYTVTREKIYTFHKLPVLSSWFQVYAPKRNKIKSILDLNGKRILVLERSVQQEAFERLSKGFGLTCSLITTPDYKTMFQMVAKGEADAAVTNRFYGVLHAKKSGLVDTAVLFEPSDLFYAATKGDPKQLLGTIDKHLTDLKSNQQSVYYASMRRWTLEQVPLQLPFWLQVVGFGGIGLLIMSLCVSALLRHQVNVRTQELLQENVKRQTAQQQHTDMLEQRVAERTAELAAINEELRTILESASTGIVLLRDRVIMGCNRKLEEISGYEPGELLGKSTRIWYPDEGSYLNGGKDVYTQMARGETFHQEQQMARKDGSLFWVRMSLCAIDIKAPFKGAVGIVEDITDEREAAEELRKAMEAAQAADHIKSAFLATMSHELRTPLNSIIGFTGIMLQGLTGPLNPEQQKQMTMVQKSSRHLLSLINDVLDISKIEAGQLVLACTAFDLRTSIEKMAELVTPLAEKKGVELLIDLPATSVTITTDQRRLEQVILNLLNNGIKFTDKGQVKLSCRYKSRHLLLSFSDTGIGMKQEELQNIFQPFRQIDTGLARKREGTGLGLSICKKIVDMMGGSIEVHSSWGQGSTFTVHLPNQPGETV